MTPQEFWDCTLAEAILFFKGKVYDWNVHRACAAAIVSVWSKDPVRPEQIVVLPFDEVDLTEDEIQEATLTDAELWRQYELQNGEHSNGNNKN